MRTCRCSFRLHITPIVLTRVIALTSASPSADPNLTMPFGPTKRQVFFNIGYCIIRSFVGPNGIVRFGSADGDAEVSAIALVRTIGVMCSRNEQRQVRIVARHVVNRRVSVLLQLKRSRRFSDDPASDRYTHLAPGRRDSDGMVRPRNPDLLTFARYGVHCAASVIR